MIEAFVRPFEPRDIPPSVALTNHFIEHTAVHFDRDPQTEAEWTKAIESKPDRYLWLTAELDGAHAGFAKSGPWRTRAAYDGTVETSIYIQEHARGKGVARVLYKQLLTQLGDLGFHIAVAGMTLPNDTSVRFHQSMGFEHVGVFKEVGREFDSWHDVAFMQRVLGPTRNP
jgi:phosphinothricin acetyltransferase